jgi:hypothetical protein
MSFFDSAFFDDAFFDCGSGTPSTPTSQSGNYIRRGAIKQPANPIYLMRKLLKAKLQFYVDSDLKQLINEEQKILDELE